MNCYFSRTNIFIFIISLCLIVVLYGLGFGFPTPWVDESNLLFQAIAFYHTNSLFTDSLSSTKIIMWIQPGYVILLGLIYKIFGYSFELSRAVSWTAYVVSFILLSRLMHKYIHRNAVLFIAIIFFYPAGLAMANVARMDSFILLFSIINLYAILEKRYVLSLSVLLFGLLFHCNMAHASIPLFGSIIFDVMEHKSFKNILNIRKVDYVFLFSAVVFVLLYMIFIFSNFTDFKNDMMSYQIAAKLPKPQFYLNLKTIIIILSMLSMAGWFVNNRSRNKFSVSLFTFSFFFLTVTGKEMWYQFFGLVSFGLFALLLFSQADKKWVKFIIISVFVLFSIKTMYGGFAGMKPVVFGEDYIDAKTKTLIENMVLDIKRKSGKQQLTVSVNRGNDLFFVDFCKVNGIKIIRMLPEAIQKFRQVDIMIEINRYQDPAWLKQDHRADYNLACIVSDKNREVVQINK